MINIREEAATHSCWIGNLGQTAHHREPELWKRRENYDLEPETSHLPVVSHIGFNRCIWLFILKTMFIFNGDIFHYDNQYITFVSLTFCDPYFLELAQVLKKLCNTVMK